MLSLPSRGESPRVPDVSLKQTTNSVDRLYAAARSATLTIWAAAGKVSGDHWQVRHGPPDDRHGVRMSFREILQQQQRGLEFMGNVGVIGLHMVSGPLVGVAIGYGLDAWLDTGPWCKLIFLLVGIGAGFLNVYRDSRRLLDRMACEDARRKGTQEAGQAAEDGPAHGQPPATDAEQRRDRP